MGTKEKRREIWKDRKKEEEAQRAYTKRNHLAYGPFSTYKTFPNESLSPKLEKEKIFRKTTTKTLEVVERPYLTVDSSFQKPKQRRKSPILNKCEDLMQILWEDGYRKEMPWHTLKEYIIATCGGFRTTITDYLGKRAKYYQSRGRKGILKTPAKQGYLERFGFIQKKNAETRLP